jgi:crossover junction endodeoxyribonuclease RuvC
MSLILGIDPGWSGGAALLRSGGDPIDVQSFANLTEADIIERVQSMAGRGEIRNDGGKITMDPYTTCYLESVHAMPKQGVTSSFRFGMIYGLLRGLVIGSCRVIDVTPQKWQKSLGCLTHGDKNISKAKAQSLFPGIKVTHHVADALLIAYYGYTQERVVEIKGE